MRKITAQEIEESMLAAGVSALPWGASTQFAEYLELLLRWNARVNLTAVRSPQDIVDRHFVECAFAAGYLPKETGSLLDFGSGAGFPGIPIAICRPDIAVTLAESQSKKAAFLSEALRVLKIPGNLYRSRVESMPDSQIFGCVALRAVDKMPEAIAFARKHAGSTLALMISSEDAAEYPRLAPEFAWDQPIPLPNRKQSILLIGRR